MYCFKDKYVSNTSVIFYAYLNIGVWIMKIPSNTTVSIFQWNHWCSNLDGSVLTSHQMFQTLVRQFIRTKRRHTSVFYDIVVYSSYWNISCLKSVCFFPCTLHVQIMIVIIVKICVDWLSGVFKTPFTMYFKQQYVHCKNFKSNETSVFQFFI